MQPSAERARRVAVVTRPDVLEEAKTRVEGIIRETGAEIVVVGLPGHACGSRPLSRRCRVDNS